MQIVQVNVRTLPFSLRSVTACSAREHSHGRRELVVSRSYLGLLTAIQLNAPVILVLYYLCRTLAAENDKSYTTNGKMCPEQ